jgi:hypothetical protein
MELCEKLSRIGERIDIRCVDIATVDAKVSVAKIVRDDK